MKLFTKQQFAQLIANGESSWRGYSSGDNSVKPVVKLFTPDANCTWLLSEIDPGDHDMAFGLADLGMGFPELGYIYLPEITKLRGRLGLPVERDRHITFDKTLSEYADLARKAERITV